MPYSSLSSLVSRRTPRKAKQASYALSDRIKKASSIDQLVRILRILRASAIESGGEVEDMMTDQNRLDWLSKAAAFGGWRYGFDRIPEEIRTQIFEPLDPDDLAAAQMRQYLSAIVRLDVIALAPRPSGTAVHAAAVEGSLAELAQLMKACVKADVDIRLILQEAHGRILRLTEVDSESIRSLSSLAWSAARTSRSTHTPTATLVLTSIAELLVSRCSLSTIEVPVASELLWSFAAASPAIMEPLAHEVVGVIEMPTLKSFTDSDSPRELSTIMWSLARLGVVGDLFRICESNLAKVSSDLISPASTVMMCSALARARRVSPLWPPPSCDGMTIEQLATVVRASAVLEWSDSVEDAVKIALKDTPESLTEGPIQLLLALSNVPAAREVFINALEEVLPASLDQCPGPAVVSLVVVLSRSPMHRSRLYEACELVRLSRLSADDCCSLMSALARSGHYDGRLVEGSRKLLEGRLMKELSSSHKVALLRAFATLLPSGICDIWESLAGSADLNDSEVVAAACWALGNRSLPTAEHLKALLPSVCRTMGDFDGVEIANVVRAFAKHRVRDDRFIEAVMEALRRGPDRMDDRARCSLLWSLRRLDALTGDVLTELMNGMGDLESLSPQELTALANATYLKSYDEIEKIMGRLLEKLAIAIRTGDIGEVEACGVCNVGAYYVCELLQKLKIPYEISIVDEVPDHHIGLAHTTVTLTYSDEFGKSSTTTFQSGSDCSRPRAYEDEIDSPSKSFGGHDRSHHGELKALRHLVGVIGGENFSKLSGKATVDINSQHPCVSCIAALWRTANVLCPNVSIKVKFPFIN